MYDCLINDIMCVIIRIVILVNTACCDSCTIVIIVILNTYATQQLAMRMAEKALPLLGSMDIFNPNMDDWSAYVKRRESFFLANEIKDNKKVAVLITVIGTKAYSLLRSILTPAKAVDKSYKQLVDTMKSHLDPQPIVIAERFRFHCWNRKEGETMVQYLAELLKLTEHCDFCDNLDEALRDRLVCVIVSVPIQKRLLAEKELDLKKAMEIAQGMEAATKQSSELCASVPANQEIQFTLLKTATDVEVKAIHKRNVILRHKNVRIVATRGTLLKYAEQLKNNKA